MSKVRNPLTGRPIKTSGRVYKRLAASGEFNMQTAVLDEPVCVTSIDRNITPITIPPPLEEHGTERTLTVTINASDVAACIGRNPYKDRDEIIAQYMHKYAPSHATQKTREQLQEDALQQAPQHVRDVVFNSIRIARESTSSSEAHNAIQTAVSTIDEPLLQDFVTSRISCQHGVRKEKHTLSNISWKTCAESVVTKDHRTYELVIREADNVRYVIKGRIDSLETLPSGEIIVVEVKNRMRRLFMDLKEYEKIQICTYLAMIPHARSAKLVEQYNDTINSIDVPRDSSWDDFILPGIVEFVNDIHGNVLTHTMKVDSNSSFDLIFECERVADNRPKTEKKEHYCVKKSLEHFGLTFDENLVKNGSYTALFESLDNKICHNNLRPTPTLKSSMFKHGTKINGHYYLPITLDNFIGSDGTVHPPIFQMDGPSDAKYVVDMSSKNIHMDVLKQPIRIKPNIYLDASWKIVEIIDGQVRKIKNARVVNSAGQSIHPIFSRQEVVIYDTHTLNYLKHPKREPFTRSGSM